MIGEPIISVDWLQFFVDCSQMIVPDGGELWRLDVHARTFSVVETVTMYGNEVGQLSRCPYSPQIPQHTGVLKIANNILYADNAVKIIRQILQAYRINVLSVTRLDICGDFEMIAGGYPSDLIKDLINGVRIKVGHSKMYLHGEDEWSIRGIRRISKTTYVAYNTFEAHGVSSSRKLDYLRYGTHNSNVMCYLYNKSKELAEVKDKPYIRQRWKSASSDVWRLEFSVKGRRLSYIEKESGVILPNDWETYFSPACITYYMALCDHYFNIRECTGQVRKDREARVRLFDDNVATMLTIADLSNTHPSNKADRQFLRRLFDEMNRQYNKGAFEAYERVRQVALTFRREHDLTEWANRKGYFFEERATEVQGIIELPTS